MIKCDKLIIRWIHNVMDIEQYWCCLGNYSLIKWIGISKICVLVFMS